MAAHRIDLNLFQVFITIYNEGNLTRASEVLNLTQPAVSHSLARLREALNDPLFTRKGNRMEPTPRARSIIDQVRLGVGTLQKTLEPQHAFDYRNANKTFRLALRDVTEAACLPLIMQRLSTTAPNLRLVSQRVERRRIESLLSSGKLDLAMDVFLPFREQICHARFRCDKFVVIARKGHPSIAEGLSLDAYMQARHILVSTRPEGLGLEDAELARLGLSRTIALRNQHYFVACFTAQQTDYLVTMPENYAKIINRGLDTVILPLPIDIPPIDLFLYWHQQLQDDPANRWLREQILATATQPMDRDTSEKCGQDV